MSISGSINVKRGMRNSGWPGLGHVAKNGVSPTHTENWERLGPKGRASCCTREEKMSARLMTRSAHCGRHRCFCSGAIYSPASSLSGIWWPIEPFPHWADWVSRNGQEMVAHPCCGSYCALISRAYSRMPHSSVGSC